MRRLTYLFDPLCGWCYGASPALGKLRQHEGLSVDLLPTGLFAGEGSFPMNAGFAAHAWQADQRIAKLSGQRFTEDYRVNVLESRTSKVDSGPATLALTAVRLTAPESEFEALNAIQHVRYVEGRDNGDPAVVAGVLTSLGLTAALALFRTAARELLAANAARISEGRAAMRRVGAQGVPTLIAHTGEGETLVNSSMLYGDPDALAAALCAA